MKIKKNTRLNILIVVLSGIFICILFFGIKKETTLLADNYEKYQTLHENTNYDIANDNEKMSNFYKKLSSSEAVNILLLGDDITYASTSNNTFYPFDKNLGNKLNQNFNSNSSFQYIESNSATVATGNDSFDKASVQPFDLAIVSFGHNDAIQQVPIDDFSQKYSDLISKLKMKNYDCTIIALLPPNLEEDNEYVSKIQYICKMNNIACIELHKLLIKSSNNSNELISNGLPTDKGYDLILNSINDLIKNQLN